MNEPTEMTAGFNYSWTETINDYPADQGWKLKYLFLKSDSKFTITSQADGSKHLINITAAVSKDYKSGFYQVTKYMENSDASIKYKFSTLNITIKPDPVSASEQGEETRSFARQMLNAIEALEQNRATKLQQSFTIAGRSIVYLTPDELIKWKLHYKNIAFAEEGKSANRKMLSVFKNPY